jgi:DNA-binding transcriptional LysR family regulator
MKTLPTELDLNLLRVFHRIYMARSVTMAGSQLRLTQSATSHALRNLRKVFQDELFVRSGLEIVPTPRADALFAPVCRMMDTLEAEVLPAVEFEPATATREFSMAMADMGEVVFLPALLRYFAVHAPLCTLRTTRIPNDGMVAALEGGIAELALGNVPDAPDHIYRQTLFHHNYVVLAADGHPRIKPRELRWREYQRERHIVVDTGPDRFLQDRTLTPKGIRRKIHVTVGGFLSVPWLVEGTDLIATVPAWLGECTARGARVRELSLPEPAEPFALYSMWHPRCNTDSGHRWLRAAIFELMRHYPNIPLAASCES